MRQIFLLLFTACIPGFLRADAFDVTANGKTIVVTENGNGTLYVVQTITRNKSMIRLGRSCMDWIKVVQDSLVLVHFHNAPRSEVYSMTTGKKVFSHDGYLYADKAQQFLYTIAADGASGFKLSKITTAGFQETGKPVSIAVPEGYTATRMFMLSKNGNKLVALLNKGKKSKVFLFDTGSGAVSKSFGSYKYYDPFEIYMTAGGKEAKDVAFMDINADGSRVVLGNQFKITLHDGTTAKTLGEFAEDPANNREDFSNTFFSPNDQLIYIGSIYKIYTCSPNTLEAIENIYVDGQRTTFRTIDQYGTTIKKESYFANEFYWNNVCVSADNHYIFSICDPSLYSSGSKEPYFWRFDIIKDGDPYYFTYK